MSVPSQRVVPGLLDEALLAGVWPVRRELGPRNTALFVDNRRLSDAVNAIGIACQLWGGGAFPLIPVSVADNTSRLEPVWFCSTRTQCHCGGRQRAKRHESQVNQPTGAEVVQPEC